MAGSCLPSRKSSKSKSNKSKKSYRVRTHPADSTPLPEANSTKVETSETSESSIAETPATNNNTSTAALIRGLIPIFIPIIRKASSKRLIDNNLILQNEEPLLTFDEKEENYPIGNIHVHIDNIVVVDTNTLKEDMDAAPSFEWPEKEHYKELMSQDGDDNDNTMLVVDLIGFDAKIHFGKGIELNIPLDLPHGLKGNVEIGSGGKIQDPWIQVTVPKLRVWFVSKTNMLYGAFMDKPSLVPYLHVNADRGKGDFLNATITEKGSVEGIVETVLAGFGPKIEKKKKNREVSNSDEEERESMRENEETGWLANLLGRKISQAMEKNLGSGGHRRPLEVDVSDMIQDGVDFAMGKPRRVAYLEESIAALEKELELARALEKSEQGKVNNAAADGKQNGTESISSATRKNNGTDEQGEQSFPHEEQGEEDGPSILEKAFSNTFCCYDANYAW